MQVSYIIDIDYLVYCLCIYGYISQFSLSVSPENLANIKVGGLPRISMSKNIGGFKFGDLVRYHHMQTGYGGCRHEPSNFLLYSMTSVAYIT